MMSVATERSAATVCLGDVCKVSMGQAPSGSSYNDVGDGYPLLAGASDLGELYPKPERYTSAPTRISEVGDIILCVRATIGDLNLSDKQYCLGRGVAGLRPHPGVLDPRYLWHVLRSKAKVLKGKGRGATFLQINRSDIEALEFSLPDVIEQKRIAAILDKADAIRRKRQQAIQLADEFLRSVFLEMFGDPRANSKNTAILPMTKVFDIKTGKLNSNAAVSGGKYPFFTCAKEVFSIDTFAFDQEALLLAGNNAQAEYDVKHYKGRFNAYQRTYVLTLLDESWSYPFFRYALEYQLKNLKRSSKGSNTKYITMEIMGRTYLPVPPVEDQKRFVGIYERYSQISSCFRKSLEEAEKLGQSLAQRAFQGGL